LLNLIVLFLNIILSIISLIVLIANIDTSYYRASASDYYVLFVPFIIVYTIALAIEFYYYKKAKEFSLMQAPQ